MTIANTCLAIAMSLWFWATMPVPQDRPVAPAHVSGRVITNQEAPIAGARISLSTMDGSTTLVDTSEDDGAFAFERVAPGVYRVGVTHPGWTGVSSEGLELEAGERYTLNLVMSAPR